MTGHDHVNYLYRRVESQRRAVRAATTVPGPLPLTSYGVRAKVSGPAVETRPVLAQDDLRRDQCGDRDAERGESAVGALPSSTSRRSEAMVRAPKHRRHGLPNEERPTNGVSQWRVRHRGGCPYTGAVGFS
jgi:hypothetical protein